MKTFFKTKAALLLLVFMALSCKKNENVPGGNYDNTSDTTEVLNDTMNTIDTDTTGTAGATGQGSTGSGSEGTKERGNTNMRTDSTSNNTGQ